MNPSSSPAARSYAPWYIALFFVVLTLILASFVVIAVRHDPGTVTNAAYEKGLDYNTTLQKAAAEKALNWKASLDVQYDGNATKLRFTLADSAGKPVTDAAVKAFIIRPVRAGLDVTADMTAENGAYVAAVELPARGLWEAYISTMKDNQQFQFKQTLNVP